MRLIFVRHGEPNYEKDCLTKLGHEEAKAAAQRLLCENIDEIFSSQWEGLCKQQKLMPL